MRFASLSLESALTFANDKFSGVLCIGKTVQVLTIKSLLL